MISLRKQTLPLVIATEVGANYNLMDIAVNSEFNKQNHMFVICFNSNKDVVDCLCACNLFALLLPYNLRYYQLQLSAIVKTKI